MKPYGSKVSAVFRNRPIAAKLLLLHAVMCFLVISVLLFNYVIARTLDEFSFWVSQLFLSIFFVCSLKKFFTEHAEGVRSALLIQCITLFIIIPFVYLSSASLFLLLNTVFLEISIYERFPVSLAQVSIFFAGAMVYIFSCGYVTGVYLPFKEMFSLAVPLIIITSSVITMIYYREKLVWEHVENSRITGVMKQLTKVNLEYQDYAIDIEEIATEQERKRITREIHDIVGYTLTNTIMMMEAAIDMMQRNPLGIAALINTTRENAQEGLEQTRSALYKLRETRIERPQGLSVIIRMFKVFSTATGVQATLLWNNLPWNYDEARNKILFYSIQQGLVNAFIHGKASNVLIEGRLNDTSLIVSIKDNGIGTKGKPIIEGIGIKGIRERLDTIKGYLEICKIHNGFFLKLHIPLDTE